MESVIAYIVVRLSETSNNKLILLESSTFAKLKKKLLIYDKIPKREKKLRFGSKEEAYGNRQTAVYGMSQPKMEKIIKCFNCGES